MKGSTAVIIRTGVAIVLVTLCAAAIATNGGGVEKDVEASKALIDNPTVLVYMGLCTDAVDYAGEALANLGVSNVTTVFSGMEFQTALGMGGWDLVIYDGYYSFLNNDILDALNTYLSSGGRIIFSDANAKAFSAHALFTTAGVTIHNDYTTPEPLFVWKPDPLFTTPNAVPDITVFSDLCNRDGVRLEPISGQAAAHGGATETAQTNKALLTSNTARNFIFNGFAPQTVTGDEDGDGTLDMVELYENEIYHLLAGGKGVLTYFTSCNGGLDYFTAALDWWSGRFSDRTYTTSNLSFVRHLDSGRWDLVIVDSYASNVNSDMLDALVRHYDRGGKTIFFSYNMTVHNAHEFMNRAGANAVSTYNIPQPIYNWNTTNLFNITFDVSDVTSFSDLCTTDGQYLQATSGIACAGHTVAYDATKAAIVMDPRRRIILNGFAPQTVTSGTQMQDLYANEIALLIFGGHGVLAYVNDCNGSTDYVSPALANLGFTDVTMAVDALDFRTHLGSGYWDLLVYDCYGDYIHRETLDALLEYDNKKYWSSHMVISAFNLMEHSDHPFLTQRVGVSATDEYEAPQPIYAWNGSILFESPNTVPPLPAFNNLCFIDGQYLTVTSATAHAGYSAEPSAGNAAIAISPDKRIILNAFTPQIVTGDADSDSKDDMIELYENEFLYASIGGKSGTLVYFNECGGGVRYANGNTIVTDSDLFRVHLAAGEWGLVIYDSYLSPFPDGALDDLVNYYDAGGRIIMSAWDLQWQAPHDFFDRAGVTPVSSYSTIQPIHVWRISPLFDTPNVVPNLSALSELCMTDGQYLQPSTATAFAGYTPAPEADAAAITVNAEARLLINGFMPQNVTGNEDGDTKLDMEELYVNEAYYLLDGAAERQCFTDAFYSQRPLSPVAGANGYYSDIECPWTACEYFEGSSNPIGGMVFWGTRSRFGDALDTTNGVENFLITFCEDAAGQPGAVIYEETVTPIIEKVNLMYWAVWLHRYETIFTAPVNLPSGWIKIRSMDVDGHYWAWVTSDEGNLISYQDGPGGFGLMTSLDFALCFTEGASGIHTGDQNADNLISLSELLRIIQFYNMNALHCQDGTEDGFAPGLGSTSCTPHNSDYNPQDWRISLSELLRLIQFFNSNGYHHCPGDPTEDGFCPGPA